MGEVPLDTLEQMRAYDRRAKFVTLIGGELSECADGRAVVTLPFREDLVQHNGYLHGALVGFLIDYPCAWAAGSVAGAVVTASYDVKFVAPGVGERFVGRGEVVKASKRQITCRAEAFAVQADGDEKLIAIGSAVCMRV